MFQVEISHFVRNDNQQLQISLKSVIPQRSKESHKINRTLMIKFNFAVFA